MDPVWVPSAHGLMVVGVLNTDCIPHPGSVGGGGGITKPLLGGCEGAWVSSRGGSGHSAPAQLCWAPCWAGGRTPPSKDQVFLPWSCLGVWGLHGPFAIPRGTLIAPAVFPKVCLSHCCPRLFAPPGCSLLLAFITCNNSTSPQHPRFPALLGRSSLPCRGSAATQRTTSPLSPPLRGPSRGLTQQSVGCTQALR